MSNKPSNVYKNKIQKNKEKIGLSKYYTCPPTTSVNNLNLKIMNRQRTMSHKGTVSGDL